MSRFGCRAALLMCCGLLLGGAGCGFDEGPSLQVEVRDTALRSTTADTSLCCCRVTGVAENLSTVPVHATLTFKAYQTSGNEEDEIGTAVAFLKDLQPNEVRSIDAPGLLMPCSTIDRLELVDIDVRGVWFPP